MDFLSFLCRLFSFLCLLFVFFHSCVKFSLVFILFFVCLLFLTLFRFFSSFFTMLKKQLIIFELHLKMVTHTTTIKRKLRIKKMPKTKLN